MPPLLFPEECDADVDPKTDPLDPLDPRQFVSHGDDAASSMCGHVDENAYHTLEVDDTELAEFPTHLALVMKRPKIGKNGEVRVRLGKIVGLKVTPRRLFRPG
jgi:hypothetical protein